MVMTDVGIGHNSLGRTRCIFRAAGERGYTKLKNTFLQDRRISDETRGLVARLLSLPEDWEVTVQSIIASGKAGRDKVYRMVKEAEEHGYIQPDVRERTSGGTLGRQVYFISDDPEALIARAAQELYEMENNPPRTENTEMVAPVGEQQVLPCAAKPDLAEPRLVKPDLAEPDLANRTRKKNIVDKINISPKDLLSNEPARVDDAPPKPKRSRPNVPDQYTYDFEEFWKLYPRREGKGEAFKCWQRLSLPHKRLAYVALKGQLSILTTKARDPRGNFCALPATWITQRRFDDDVSETPAPDKYGSIYDGVL